MNDYGMLTKIYAQIHTYIIPSYIHTHLHPYTDTYVDTGLITSIYATMHAYRKNVLEKMPYGVMSWTNVGEKMSGEMFEGKCPDTSKHTRLMRMHYWTTLD